MRISYRLTANMALIFAILTGIVFIAAYTKHGSVTTGWTIVNVSLYTLHSCFAISLWGKRQSER